MKPMEVFVENKICLKICKKQDWFQQQYDVHYYIYTQSYVMEVGLVRN